MTKCWSHSQEDLLLGKLSHQEATWRLRAGRMCKTSGGTDPTDLASLDEEEDDGSVKLKEHVAGGKPNTTRTSAEIPHLARRRSVTDMEPGSALPWKKILSQARRSHLERGTGALSHAAEQDACVLHENGGDQSMYSCPSPTKVVTIWSTWQRRHRSRCGLTRRHLTPMRVITWIWLPQLSSIRNSVPIRCLNRAARRGPRQLRIHHEC